MKMRSLAFKISEFHLLKFPEFYDTEKISMAPAQGQHASS